MSSTDAPPDGGQGPREGDGAPTRPRCVCGMTTETMDGFVDHVTDDHDALDVAVRALLVDDQEAFGNAE